MESQAYTEKMVNDGGTSDEYFETGSDVSLLIEPGPTEPPATTTTTAPPSPKRIFVTSGTWNGNLGGLSGADAKCQEAATNAGLPGTYMAWVSTFEDYIYYRVPAGEGFSNYYYVLVDGTRIADDIWDLTDTSLQTAINKNEFGDTLNTTTWTGSDAYGNVGDATCLDWTDATSGVTATMGTSSATDGTWSDNGTASCNSLKSLYCIEV